MLDNEAVGLPRVLASLAEMTSKWVYDGYGVRERLKMAVSLSWSDKLKVVW